ncbi:hypothetical protein [Actinoplanes missouriensis]|nr:hypothetical protein [Actinoplanes missouriensis]
MTDSAFVTVGPWRIRRAVTGANDAVISYRTDDKYKVITLETNADLALLRDAITEYLTATEVAR